MERICALLMLMLFALPTQAAVQMHYLHNDHLGTPRVVTNQARQVVWKGQLKPFGETKVVVEAITNHRRFPGQRLDIESMLYYNYFRDYDPRTGRYMQSDPIGLGGGVNTYTYVGGSPVMYIDPLGLAKVCYRPLDSWMTPVVLGRRGSPADYDNNIIGHQHIFFDNGRNIGFGQNGLFSEENREEEYSMCEDGYDDGRMERAVRITPPGNYYFFFKNNNCQDWVDNVLNSYNQLK